jgi:hypothetical protein
MPFDEERVPVDNSAVENMMRPVAWAEKTGFLSDHSKPVSGQPVK